MYVCQLSENEQLCIGQRARDALALLGYEGQELQDLLFAALCGRVCDLEDLIVKEVMV